MHDDDDSEDEALASTLVEALQAGDEVYDDMEPRTGNVQISGDDIQQRLASAAQPLEFQATLGARFASYDNYCSLFHFILNSDGPVDLELPTVSDSGALLRIVGRTSGTWRHLGSFDGAAELNIGWGLFSITGLGMSSMNSSTSLTVSACTATMSQGRAKMRRRNSYSVTTRRHGAVIAFSTSSTH